MTTLHRDDPIAVALVRAIRAGECHVLRTFVEAHPGLASASLRFAKGSSFTPLHVVTDSPGYFPNGPEVVSLLIRAGGDPNAAVSGGAHAETPLHWAASSDDADVAVALIDGGADLEAPSGSIGTPLDNAVGYGCWHVARLLVERGARVERLWHAAALGMLARLKQLHDASPRLTSAEMDEAFWQACHGGQRRTAEYLLAKGATINRKPSYAKGTALDVASGLDTRRETLVSWLIERGASSAVGSTGG